MSNVNDYEKRVWNTLGSIAKGKKVHVQWNTVAEAKLQKAKITQVQKELRLIKKEVGTTKKIVNAQYAAEMAKVGKGFGAGVAAGLFGKKTAGKINTLNREAKRQQQLNAILPYENVIRLIDGIVVQLDELKLKIESWIVQNT